jgi:hypothetical protein
MSNDGTFEAPSAFPIEMISPAALMKITKITNALND